MKKVFYSAFLLVAFTTLVHSQNYSRKVFNYNQMEKESPKCDDATMNELNNSLVFLQQNNSDAAVISSKKTFEKNIDCPASHEIFGLCLFRNGKLLEGISIIDDAIERFGSVPELIRRRSELSIELYSVGVSQRNIDGNTVFVSGVNQLPYDEEQFKQENLKSALLDLEYLTSKFPDHYEEIFTLAKIHQALGNFEQSTVGFEQLIPYDEFRDNSLYNIAENCIQIKDYANAEKRLFALTAMHPDNSQILNKLSELYELTGNLEKKEEYRKKSVFYSLSLYSADFEYNDKNYEVITFFESNENSKSKKSARLNQLKSTENQNYVIDLCLSILKMHANHGNGIEEEATKILEKIGKPALYNTHKLIQTNISTCTMTNLAQIMATIKDESSWELLVSIMNQITSMPSTLIPPNIPEQVIEFDEEKGTKEILKVIQLEFTKKIASTSDLIFGSNNYLFFSALKKVNRQKVLNSAKEVGFTDKEIKRLKRELDNAF